MTERPDSAPAGGGNANLAVAFLVLFGAGFFWLFALYGIGVAVGEKAGGVIWAVCAGALWIPESIRMAGARDEPGAVWWLTFRWWLKSFAAPAFLAADVLMWFRLTTETQPPSPRPLQPDAWVRPAVSPPRSNPGPEPGGLARRLDDFARRLAALERELADLRLAAEATAPEPTAAPVLPEPTPVLPEPPAPVVAPPPPPPPPPVAEPRPPIPTPPRADVSPTPPPMLPSKPATPPWWSDLTFADLFSARVLAWAGGVVTLLGILFFFVLAVNRGWIGPVARVSLGAIASALVFSGGLTLRRKFGHLYYSAYGAAGAGIGGGYGTLLAATLRYHLLSDWAAVLVAAAIGGIAVLTALAWSSELIAGLGLVGATLAPAAVSLQNGELSTAGTGFAAFVFAGTVIVAVSKNWQPLLLVGVAATLPQAAVLVAQGHGTDWGSVGAAAAVWLILLAAAIALQLRLRTADLAPLPTGLVLISAPFAGLAAAAQLSGRGLGSALVVAAGVYAVAAALLFRRRRERDLSALLGAVGLALLAIGGAELLSGPVLAIAWAAEAAVLAWLARRVGEVRYQLGSVAYLAAALVHALALDAPLRQLYQANAHPASGSLAFVGVAVAGAIVAYYCRAWEAPRTSAGMLAPLQPLVNAFRESQRQWRSLTGWTAALAGLYAASLGLLAIPQWSSGSVDRAFGWGHVAVNGLWGLSALGVLSLGLHRQVRELRTGGNVWLGAVLLEAVLFDLTSLQAGPRGFAVLVAAAALVAGALLDRSERDPSALLAAAGLTLAAVAFGDILSGTTLVAVWAGLAALLAWFARRIGQTRYQLASLGYLAAALVHGVALDAPPSHLYEASGKPASGALALLLVSLAGAVVAFYARPWPALEAPGGVLAPLDPTFDEFRSRQPLWRSAVGWTSALAALYVASLAILDLAQRLGSGTQRPFEWGHVAVIGLWGAVALAVLQTGWTRSWMQFRAAGLVWLGAVLAQAGLFVSTQLSGDRRGFAFLVAASALLAGSLLDRLHRPEKAVLPLIGTYAIASLAVAVAGLVLLVGGRTAEGLSLLALAALYCGIATLVFGRDRDLATLLWALGLGVALVAFAEPLSGTWLVLAWTATGAAMATVAARARERRLQVATLGYVLPALVHALWLEAPPSDFFESTRHPASGVPAVVFVALAVVILVLVARARGGRGDAFDRTVEGQQRIWLRFGLATGAVLGLYAVSLSILGLAEEISSGSTVDRFHGGHAAVSAVWGLLGLVALYLGLSRRLGWLQALGFGLFAVSLAKIFLYDLTFLSSVARALSFLAVGAVLLLGGFFVQKLGAQRRGAAPSSGHHLDSL